MCHEAVARPGHGVHADEERRVAPVLEGAGVLGRLLLDDELAPLVELLGDQRVERPALAGAVAVHDDHLGRAAGAGAAHRGVDLLGVELSPLLVERLAAGDLLPVRDARRRPPCRSR